MSTKCSSVAEELDVRRGMQSLAPAWHIDSRRVREHDRRFQSHDCHDAPSIIMTISCSVQSQHTDAPRRSAGSPPRAQDARRRRVASLRTAQPHLQRTRFRGADGVQRPGTMHHITDAHSTTDAHRITDAHRTTPHTKMCIYDAHRGWRVAEGGKMSHENVMQSPWHKLS
jgi:hypothetical protein